MVPRSSNFVEARDESIHLPRGLFALFMASVDGLRVFELPFADARCSRPAMMDSRVVFARQSMRLVYQNYRFFFPTRIGEF